MTAGKHTQAIQLGSQLLAGASAALGKGQHAACQLPNLPGYNGFQISADKAFHPSSSLQRPGSVLPEVNPWGVGVGGVQHILRCIKRYDHFYDREPRLPTRNTARAAEPVWTPPSSQESTHFPRAGSRFRKHYSLDERAPCSLPSSLSLGTACPAPRESAQIAEAVGVRDPAFFQFGHISHRPVGQRHLPPSTGQAGHLEMTKSLPRSFSWNQGHQVPAALGDVPSPPADREGNGSCEDSGFLPLTSSDALFCSLDSPKGNTFTGLCHPFRRCHPGF